MDHTVRKINENGEADCYLAFNACILNSPKNFPIKSRSGENFASHRWKIVERHPVGRVEPNKSSS